MSGLFVACLDFKVVVISLQIERVVQGLKVNFGMDEMLSVRCPRVIIGLMGVLWSRNLGFCRHRVADRFPFLGYQSIRFRAYRGPRTHYYRLSRGPQPRYPGTSPWSTTSRVNYGLPHARQAHFSTKPEGMIGTSKHMWRRMKEQLHVSRARLFVRCVSHTRLRFQGYVRIGLPSLLLTQYGPFLRLQRREDFQNHSELRRRQCCS